MSLCINLLIQTFLKLHKMLYYEKEVFLPDLAAPHPTLQAQLPLLESWVIF